MSSWKGNRENPAPNNVQESMIRSEKIIGDNRANQIRRDTDDRKNFTISLYDIDETILLHLENLQLQVQDQGKIIKVPFFYGSPERWVSAQRDGYIRDKQGKIILPAIILKRTNSENDSSLQFFNRYLNTPVMKTYSEKNAYTQFSLLAGKNVPINEVYNIVMPKHMVLTYHFIVWTAYVEQMNKLIESINYNTQDYWGSKKGFRFRTKVEAYGHAVEIQANEERIVKTEFDLVTHGYILPDSMTKLESHEMTTKKFLTPKKVIIGTELVSNGFDMTSGLPNYKEMWRNPNYPNLPKEQLIPQPSPTLVTGTTDSMDAISAAASVLGTLKNITESPVISPIPVGVDTNRPLLRVVSPPTTMAAVGQEGYVSYDSEYFYIYAGNGWKRVAISEFTNTPPCQEGTVSFNNQYMYLYSSGSWRQVAINKFQ